MFVVMNKDLLHKPAKVVSLSKLHVVVNWILLFATELSNN